MIRYSLQRVFDAFRGPLRPRILVAGLQKSGTTAIAMLLGEASGLSVNSDPFYRLDRAGIDFRDALYGDRVSLSRVIEKYRQEFRGDVVKEPEFSYFLDDLRSQFESSGFVFIVRDPRDNIRSILNRLKLPGRPHEAGEALRNIPPTWRHFVEGRMPSFDCPDYVRCAAERWRFVARQYLTRRDRGYLRLMRYEDFVDDKPGTINTVLMQLGLDGGQPIEHVMDKQFQSRGDRSVDWGEFFGEGILTMIEDVCGEEMTALGYSMDRTSA